LNLKYNNLKFTIKEQPKTLSSSWKRKKEKRSKLKPNSKNKKNELNNAKKCFLEIKNKIYL